MCTMLSSASLSTHSKMERSDKKQICLHISDQFLPHPERTVHFFIIDIPVIRRREDDHGQHRYADQEFDQIAGLVHFLRMQHCQEKHHAHQDQDSEFLRFQKYDQFLDSCPSYLLQRPVTVQAGLPQKAVRALQPGDHIPHLHRHISLEVIDLERRWKKHHKREQEQFQHFIFQPDGDAQQRDHR